MIGIDLVTNRETRAPDPDLARHVISRGLRCGWIVLAGGPDGNVISLSPPLTLSCELMRAATKMLDEVIGGAET